MKLGLREAFWVVILVSIPVSAWWLVFRPHNVRNAEMRKEIGLKQEKLKVLNRAVGTIGNLRKEIAALQEAVAFFESKLPSEKEIDKVLQEVWRLAEANKLVTKSIRTLQPKTEIMLTDPAGPYAEQPISMQLEGPFEGFYGFLLALERQPRIMRIQQMELKKLAKAPEGHVRAECNVVVFFERSGKE